MTPATITYRCHAQTIAEPGTPLMLIDKSAYLRCGCTVHAGLRLDKEDPATGDYEAATGAVPCSSEHHGLVDHFNLLLRESLVDPQPDVLLIDVVAELLGQAEEHWQPR